MVGSTPLPPLLSVFCQPSDGYRTIGGCPSGGVSKHNVKKSPQERLLVSLEDFNRDEKTFKTVEI